MRLGIWRSAALVSLSLIFVIGFTSSQDGNSEEPITVSTDKITYDHNSTIFVNGKVTNPESGTPVSLTVISPTNHIVTLEQLSIDTYGNFNTQLSTLGSLWADDGTYTIRVQYGNQAYSNKALVELVGGDSITQQPSGNNNLESGCDLNSHTLPSVVLDRLPFNVIKAGETIVFTGRLICENGYKHSNVEIIIFENHLLSSDETLITTYTDTNGEFSVPWVVKTYSIIRQPTTIQAKYETEPMAHGLQYKPASEKFFIQIDRQLAEISLDPLPKSAEIGETLFFTGKLELASGDPEGYIVYIKDEDPYDADDLLATGYVESDGSFSANWIATITDDDRITDVYVVFEGAGIYWRVTSCDYGITRPLGGACQFTIKLQITGELPPFPPLPPTGPLDSDNDGIPDDRDQCKFTSETYNGYWCWSYWWTILKIHVLITS